MPAPRIFVAHPLTFDGIWVDWYLRRYVGVPLNRGPQSNEVMAGEALVGGADKRMLAIVAAFAVVDIGAFPDAVEIAVKVDAGVVAVVKFIGRRDDHFEGGVDAIVAMLLAARQRARIAAQVRKVRSDIFTNGHKFSFPSEPPSQRAA